MQETEWYGGAERSQYYEYDTAGNNISHTALDSTVTKYAYDVFGNVTYALLPDGTEKFFEYDYNGNCQSAINGAGEEILYTYDGLNRLTKQETTSGETRSISRNYYNFRNNAKATLDAENNRSATYQKNIP
ncbi:MAG: RHS repeat protein [Clostridia bacterium]|nr:RHS repeat protein [Clostridia bacterium]